MEWSQEQDGDVQTQIQGLELRHPFLCFIIPTDYDL